MFRARTPLSSMMLAAVALLAPACGNDGGSGSAGPTSVALRFTLDTIDEPVAGVRVSLVGADGEYSALSDADGRASFRGVQEGDYQLRYDRLPRGLEPQGGPAELVVGSAPDTVDVSLRFGFGDGEILLYGDDDSSDELPFPSSMDRFLEGNPELERLLGFGVTIVNRASLGASVARGLPGVPAAGVDVVDGTLEFHVASSLVLLRYGRVDVERYLNDPTAEARERFTAAYRETIADVLRRRDVPVLALLSMPADGELRAGTRAANQILELLAAELDLPLVPSGLDARRSPELFGADGSHHSDAGQEILARQTVDAIFAYYTGSP